MQLITDSLPGWKRKLIRWLAGKEPVILNMTVFCNGLPENKMAVILLPHPEEIKPSSFYEERCFLVPSKNIEPNHSVTEA